MSLRFSRQDQKLSWSATRHTIAEAAIEARASAACVLTGGFSSEALLEAGCFAVADDLRALLPSLQRGEPPATTFNHASIYPGRSA
jgi:hypothetical protein